MKKSSKIVPKKKTTVKKVRLQREKTIGERILDMWKAIDDLYAGISSLQSSCQHVNFYTTLAKLPRGNEQPEWADVCMECGSVVVKPLSLVEEFRKRRKIPFRDLP